MRTRQKVQKGKGHCGCSGGMGMQKGKGVREVLRKGKEYAKAGLRKLGDFAMKKGKEFLMKKGKEIAMTKGKKFAEEQLKKLTQKGRKAVKRPPTRGKVKTQTGRGNARKPRGTGRKRQPPARHYEPEIESDVRRNIAEKLLLGEELAQYSFGTTGSFQILS